MQTQMLVDEAVGELKSRIDDTAIIACSGGIDSTVAATNQGSPKMEHTVMMTAKVRRSK